VADAKHFGNDRLNLGGILRRGVDDDLAFLPGIGERGLRLEIELLLAADVERATEAMGRGGECGIRVAGGDAARDAEVALLGDCLFEIEERFLLGDVELDGGEARGECFARLGGDERDGLADVEEVLIGEDRLWPGTSATVRTAATPGIARAAVGSMLFSVPAAIGEPTKPTRSSPTVRGRSSI
jgi:hypothetical protein